jgi:hypothetical protein
MTKYIVSVTDARGWTWGMAIESDETASQIATRLGTTGITKPTPDGAEFIPLSQIKHIAVQKADDADR